MEPQLRHRWRKSWVRTWARLAELGFGHPDALGVTWKDVLGEW